MKKLFIACTLIISVFFAMSCSNSNPIGNPKTLIVVYQNGKTQKTAEAYSKDNIEKAFKNGGAVDVSIEMLREIDPEFDAKYAISNNEGNFKPIGALISFLNDRGWKYQELSLGMLVMVK